MLPTPTATLQVHRDLQETVYTLPRRSLGAFRFVGLLPGLFGLLFLVFGTFWVLNSSRSFFAEGTVFVRVFSLLHLLFGVPLFVAGAGLFLLGAGLALNQWSAQIRMDRERLRYREQWGVIRWTWSRDLADIEELVIVDASITQTHAPAHAPSPATVRPAPALGCITVKGSTMTPLLLLPGYPLALLRDLARMLSRDAAAVSPHGGRPGQGAFKVTEASGSELAERGPPDTRAPDSVTPPPVP